MILLIGFQGPIFTQLAETAPDNVIPHPLSRLSLNTIIDGLQMSLAHRCDEIIFIMGDLMATAFAFKAISPYKYFGKFKKVTMIFADGEKPQWVKHRKSFEELADKVVRMDVFNDEMDRKVIPGIYLPIKKEDWHFGGGKDIDFAFYGSLALYSKRKEIISFLQDAKTGIITAGGEETRYQIDMMDALRRTKVTLNFSSCISKPGKSHNGEVSQIKGRLWEAMVAKTVVIEDRNSESSKLFTDDEIVWYDDYREIPSLVDKLLTDYAWRETIVENAYRKATKYCDPDYYWGKLLA